MPHESTMGEHNRPEDHQVNDLPSRAAGDESIFRTEARVTLDFEALVGLERSESNTQSLQATVEDSKCEAISGVNDDLGTPDLAEGASKAPREEQEPGPHQANTDLLAALSALDELETTNLKLQTSLDAGANETSSTGRPADGTLGFKSSVKVVVWSKSKKAAGTSQSLGESGCSSSRNLFIVNQAKRKLDTQQSAVQSHDKVSKKRRKRVEFVTDSPRQSNRVGVKTKKGHVKLSKPEEYKRFIQSYISSRQCVSKTERMKENGDSNLMWLLDFKVDKLFQTPAQEPSVPKFSSEFEHIMADLQSDQQCPRDSSMLTSVEPADQQPANAIANISNFDPMNPEHAFTVDIEAVDNVANFEQVESQAMPMPVDTVEESRKSESKTSCEPTQPTEQVEYTPPEITFDEQGKPRCTYTDLIERALTQSGGLTVSEIYQWISDNYPFFRADDDRWKNSVRHNLSINPYFKKGEKARSGAGHLWTISEESRALKPALRKKDSEYEEINMLIENDTDRAVASILGQYNLAKANMDGKVPAEMSSTSKRSTEEASKEVSPVSQENVQAFKPAEENTVAPVFLEYDPGNEFSEFTIELNGLNIPDSSSFEFQDLLSGGRLIVIQSEDQDSDKENSMRLGDTSLQNLDEYMANEFSVMQGESHSTETERVSGQLISEALTQDFDSLKNSEKVSNHTESNGYHLSVSHFERLPGGSDSDDFMVLDSMDPVSLQEVIQNSTDHGVSDQYHNLLNLSGSPYEPKEMGYCEYDHQIAL